MKGRTAVDIFYLGTHQVDHLERAGVPLFVSHRRLAGRKTLPRAIAEYAVDSGAYTELLLHGRWTVSPQQYCAAIRRYDAEIGRVAWAAPQDWCVESNVLTATGLSVEDHQRLTVENFLELQQCWGDRDQPWMPVLQGYSVDEYKRCWEMYAKAGVDLKDFPLVGVGSVCRRQATSEIDAVVAALLRLDPGLPRTPSGPRAAVLPGTGTRSVRLIHWPGRCRRGGGRRYRGTPTSVARTASTSPCSGGNECLPAPPVGNSNDFTQQREENSDEMPSEHFLGARKKPIINPLAVIPRARISPAGIERSTNHPNSRALCTEKPTETMRSAQADGHERQT